ncbi:MAG: type I pantothenate kinase [Arsenophonus endosymbiont of Ceratovacuna japonica]
MQKQQKLLFTHYLEYNAKYFTTLCDSISLKLTNEKLLKLKDINNKISIYEINKIYLPISQLLNFYISSSLHRQIILNKFLNTKDTKVPYIIGITGGISAGKSTISRILQILLNSWSEHQKIDIITTDSFLYPNKILNKHGIINKKGFPQSYDMYNLIKFISNIKSGIKEITAPIYSHLTYDIISNKKQLIKKPDILIIEGLNILQSNINCLYNSHNIFISDLIDFSIYIDAPEILLRTWYIDRFLKFCKDSFYNPYSYFYHYSKLNKKEKIKIAKTIWKKINKINLNKNIIPTKERANLIITKELNHSIINIKLRK